MILRKKQTVLIDSMWKLFMFEIYLMMQDLNK